MIVEGAEVKPAGARAPQDHVAVIIPNDQWSPSQQGEEEEEEDDWSEFMPSCGMQRSRAWCGTPPILGVVNMVGTRNFTCYMGAL